MVHSDELPIIPRGGEPVGELEVARFFKHVCPPSNGDDNPDPQPADVIVNLQLTDTYDLDLPDGEQVRMWIIRDTDDSDNGRSFPSKTLRVPEGAVVHADVGASQGTHTIHWHGIEPTPMNDGVGHTSFEINGNFTYQFQPRHAGTYFYHCHKNTPLHFEMGLYGLLIVDPPDPANPGVFTTYPDGGPGYAARFNPDALAPTDHVARYDVEAFWVADDIDRVWHAELGHDAFMQDCDADDPVNPEDFSRDGILNDFRPDIFMLTGVPRRQNDATPFTPANSPALVAPTVGVGQTLLIRALNGSYTTARFTFDHEVEVIGMDGYGLGIPPFQQYSRPFIVPAGTPFVLTNAMRRDLLVRPIMAGDIHASVEFLQSVRGELLYTAEVTIGVTA